MFFRKSKLIRVLAAEIMRLREALARLTGERDAIQHGYEDMKRIANEALKVAHKQEFPKGKQDIWVDNKHIGQGEIKWEFQDLSCELLAKYLPDPDPHEVKHCPACNVSVRATEWPQECPACHCLFGFAET